LDYTKFSGKIPTRAKKGLAKYPSGEKIKSRPMQRGWSDCETPSPWFKLYIYIILYFII